MEIGAVHSVTTGDCSDLYYMDTGMYGTDEYGAVYILDDERPALIETGIGTNYELICAALEEVGIDREELEVIAVTHIHLDHAGGAGHIADACPNASVYVSSVGARHLIDPEGLVAGTKQAVGEQWRYYAEPEPIPAGRIVEIDGGDTIDLGTHELRVHEAPGHAPHQVVFEDPANDAVFTGDAAGIWVPSLERIKETSPPPQFDLEKCVADVGLIRDLGRSVVLYTHFGPRAVSDVSGGGAGGGHESGGGDNGASDGHGSGSRDSNAGGDQEGDGGYGNGYDHAHNTDSDSLEQYATVLETWVEAVADRRLALESDEEVIEAFASEAAESEFADVWSVTKARTETAMNVRGVLTYLDREVEREH